jgi:hypothetical protein
LSLLICHCIFGNPEDKILLMPRTLSQWILICALLCLVIVLIAPSVDLPDAGLRSLQAAQAILACLAMIAVFLLLASDAERCPLVHPSQYSQARGVALLCVFLC